MSWSQGVMPVMEIIMPQQSGGNVPAFLAKLWKMIDNPETDLMISWTEEGNSFIIKNQADFARDLLPYYYKHSNMASFIRQLNMYGFHKVLSVDSGGLKGEREEVEFAHPYFLRGQEHLLGEIKRKVAKEGTKPPNSFIPSIKSDKVTEVLTEVSMLKDRQEDTDNRLEAMRQENEALWQEVLNLRQKHSQQQKIVNKLIHFLMAVVQPRMAGVKRRFTAPVNQLAIEAANQKQAKEPKLDLGPVIQDVTHNDPFASLLDGEESPSIELPPTPNNRFSGSVNNDTSSNNGNGNISPGGNLDGKYRLVDPSSVNPAIMQVGKTPASSTPLSSSTAISSSPKRPALNREISKEDFDLDINNMQAELDNLKDILSGQITLDSSLVSSLFSPEELLANFPGGNLTGSLPANISLPADGLLNDEPELTGDSQLVSYNPSLFELTEEDNDTGFIESLGEGRSRDLSTPNMHTDRVPDSVLNTPQIAEDMPHPLSGL